MAKTTTKIFSCETKEGKGGKFANLTFINKDGVGKTSCKIWSNVLQGIPANFLRVGNVVELDVSKDAKFGWTIASVELVSEAPIGLTEEQRIWLWDDLYSWLRPEKGFNEKIVHLLQSVKELYDELKDSIMIAPASINYHHNYVGGLLLHTWELVRYISMFEETMSTETYITAIASALIHDLGKTFEYAIDLESGQVEYREQFKEQQNLTRNAKVTAHIYWIHNWAVSRGLLSVAHAVGSHHGLEEWGSMFPCSTPEANMVFMADYHSSRFGLLTTDDLCNSDKVCFYEFFKPEDIANNMNHKHFLAEDENIDRDVTITQDGNITTIIDGSGLEMSVGVPK